MSYNNQLAVIQQYFASNAVTESVEVLQQIWLYEIIGVCYWCVNIPQCGYMEHGFKDIAFRVKKHIAPRAVCYNFSLVHNKPLGAPAYVKLVYDYFIVMRDMGTYKQSPILCILW